MKIDQSTRTEQDGGQKAQTSQAGGEGTKANEELFTLKVVENNPVTGEPEHKTVEVDFDGLINYAQKGHRFEDKMSKLNTLVDQKADIKAAEIAEKRAVEIADSIVDNLQREAKKDENFVELGSMDESLMSDTEKQLLSHIKRQDSVIKAIRDKEKADAKERDRVSKMVDDYNKYSKQAMIDYPGIDGTKLKELVLEANIPPSKVGVIAKQLYDSLRSNQSVEVDSLKKKDKEKLIRTIKQRFKDAPSVGLSGGEVQDTRDSERPPKTADSILTASKALLAEMEQTGQIQD
jgi:hypothetical protein